MTSLVIIAILKWASFVAMLVWGTSFCMHLGAANDPLDLAGTHPRAPTEEQNEHMDIADRLFPATMFFLACFIVLSIWPGFFARLLDSIVRLAYAGMPL